MIKSFRFRLTAWYLGLFSLLFVLFGMFLYGVLSTALRDRLDETLRSDMNTAVGMFEDELDETKGDVQAAASETATGMRVMGAIVAVFEGDRILAASGGASRRDLEAVAGQSSGFRWDGQLAAIPGYGAHGARAAGRLLRPQGRSIVVLALGPLDFIDGELLLVRRALFISLPLVWALAGIGGYLLATRSLRPLGWMAKQAREISGASLNRRLEIGDAADELMVLASSFNELLARLDRSFETERRFVADASHELRTPLAVIRGEADVALSHERGAAEYKESLAVILDESRRLSRLVDDLLNLARADSGRVVLRRDDFYFNDLVAECCRSLQPAASGRGIHLECRCEGDAQFRGDEELLRRMTMNLLDNAIRYTPREGKVVAELEVESTGLRLRVTDTGPGIAPEAAPKIFERFFRADESRSRQNGGFGLGLSIVKWIAEAHNGAVELSSQRGTGSAFTVTLPR